MKFDFVIGNPPYNETQESTSDNPVYNEFMDASYKIADNVEFITPARFLFNAGKTSKTWNEKMLNDSHLKVLYYEPDSSKIFSNTDIKGGVAITYRNGKQQFGAIGIFTVFPELNSIIKKVHVEKENNFSKLIYSPESYKFSKLMHIENDNIKELLSNGHAYDLTSNIFDKLKNIVFYNDKPNDKNQYIRILGRKNNNRIYMWIQNKYIECHGNLYKYKVFLPKSNGTGALGEVLSTPVVIEPGIGHTQTFISIGAFDSEFEAKSVLKYLKTKFLRILLGILKVTQDNKKSVWKMIPLQDFTDKSDIDWTVSVKQIDKQLYKKYNLTDDEIKFIESHVKEME